MKKENIFIRLWKWSKKNQKISIPIAVVVILIILGAIISGGGTQYQTVEIKRGDFKKEIRISGKVIPFEEATLAFQTYGEVKQVLVDIGDEVKKGDLLAVLERRDLAADLSGAQANLLVEQQTLNQINEGTRQEEIAVKEEELRKAEQALNNSKIALIDTLRQTYTTADGFVRSKADLVFDDPYSDPEVFPLSTSYGLRSRVDSARKKLNNILDEWREKTGNVDVSNYSEALIDDIQGKLDYVRVFADDLIRVVSDFEPGITLTEDEIENYRTIISTGRSDIDAVIKDLLSKEEAVRQAQVSFEVTKKELELKKAGPTLSDVQVQQAKISARVANVESVRSQDAQRYLKAPFSGVVTDKMIKLGDSVQTGAKAFTLVAEGGFEIETFIPEVFISGISIGDKATLEFDAYPGIRVGAEVVQTDPRSIERNGVATFRTLLHMNDEKAISDIRIGMTVDSHIISEQRENIVSVPLRSVINEDGNYFVFKKVGNKYKKTGVSLGDRDTSGNREVLEGLIQGDVILQNPKEYK